MHYYDALTVLFRIENALRVFVFAILKNELQQGWVDFTVATDESGSQTIKSIAKQRENQARAFGYLGYPVSCPIMYLTSGELIRLIVSDAGWKYFARYFLGTKTIIQNKLDEIGNIRNSLAHFRPVKADDVDVVKQNAKHVLVGVEKCLLEMFGCRDVVPTNLSEDWYREIKTLGTDNCQLFFFQSGDGEWIRIRIRYNCPILVERRVSEEIIRYRVLNLVSPSVLREFPTLANLLTYLSEDVPFIPIKEKPDFRKNILLVFSRKVLSRHFKEVKSTLESMLLKVSEETELIKQDHLARGKLIEAVNALAIYKEKGHEGEWSIRTSELSCEVKEDDPPDFWGDLDPSGSDFISATVKYPWMATEVSEFGVPF